MFYMTLFFIFLMKNVRFNNAYHSGWSRITGNWLSNGIVLGVRHALLLLITFDLQTSLAVAFVFF